MYNKYNVCINIIYKYLSKVFEYGGGIGYRYFHSLYTTKIALKLMKDFNLSEKEKEIIILSCLFHDIGKINNINSAGVCMVDRDYEEKNNLPRHEIVSAKMVRELLANKFSAETIENVCEIIVSEKSTNICTQIFQAADDISETGFMGVWRTTTYSAFNKQSLKDCYNYVMKSCKIENGKIITKQINLQNGKKSIENNYFILRSFYINLMKEIELNDSVILTKYNKYINIIKEKFKDSFEINGGLQYRIHHSLYVLKIALQIMKAITISKEEENIVILACLFHDLGKSQAIYNNKRLESFKEFESLNNLLSHEESGALMIKEVLKDDFSQTIIEKICDAIADKKDTTLVSKILNDADDLAEFGLIEVYRLFYYSAYKNRNMKNTIYYWKYYNYFKKSNKVIKMNFLISKLIGFNKLATTNNFILNFEKECIWDL